MASGRMLRACISESEQVANLTDDTVRLVFLFVLAHADVEGRYSANPLIVKGKVMPLLDISIDKVKDALLDLDDNGLVYLYEADGKPYLNFPGWERHQKLRKDRESPRYPPPSEAFPKLYAEHSPSYRRAAARRLPGALPASAGVSLSTSSSQEEVQDQVQNQTEEQTNGSAAAPVGSRRPASENGDFLEIFNNHRGKLPEARELNHKRRDGLRRLVAEHGAEAARVLLADAAKCAAANPFWLERGYGLDNLLSKEGRVLEKAEKWRSGGTPEMKKASDIDRVRERYKELGL